ncbi:MAG: hypothetical protein KKB50_03860 [Planctomycetes bacterium]|nr:hypothetical protein [Planctomycetota bacterium]
MKHGSCAFATSPAAWRAAGRRRLSLLLGLAATLVGTGCAVPQPRGGGQLSHVVEPTSKRGYWLYLPADYMKASASARASRTWPLVVTFHGMKPFDNARPQACEWEQEADRYNFVVLAPQLLAPDVLRQFPLHSITPAFKSDELATLAIMDHVAATLPIDRGNVLATSWSSGGYMAHYMFNRHPGRFTCLAVRQSNFSAEVLDPAATAESQYHPVLVLSTENDFAGCQRESREAIKWYTQHSYKNNFWIMIKDRGHERTPDMAADFFGRVAGIQPKHSPTALVQRQAIDGNPEGLAFLAGQSSRFQVPPTEPARGVEVAGTASPTAPRPSGQPQAWEPSTRGDRGVVRQERRPYASTGSTPTPERSADTAQAGPERSPLSIHVSSAIGIEPLHLGFWAECPPSWQRTANFLWTLDGVPICNGVNGQKTLAEPKEYTLGLRVVTADDEEYRAARLIRVLPRLNAGKLPASELGR